MRSLSAADTRPSKTRRSVPRLSPVQRVRTRASSGPGGGRTTGRSSAAPRVTYQRARALPFIGAFRDFALHHAHPPSRSLHDRACQPRRRRSTRRRDLYDADGRPVHGGAAEAAPVRARVNAATYAGLAALDGLHPRHRRLVALSTASSSLCFLVATPWTVLGFWNAVIGLWLLHGRTDGHRSGRALRGRGRTAPSRSGCAPPS